MNLYRWTRRDLAVHPTSKGCGVPEIYDHHIIVVAESVEEARKRAMGDFDAFKYDMDHII